MTLINSLKFAEYYKWNLARIPGVWLLGINENLLLLYCILSSPPLFRPLSTNPTKWFYTLKQFVGNSRRIVWMCLTILWGWRLEGWLNAFYIIKESFRANPGINPLIFWIVSGHYFEKVLLMNSIVSEIDDSRSSGSLKISSFADLALFLEIVSMTANM